MILHTLVDGDLEPFRDLLGIKEVQRSAPCTKDQHDDDDDDVDLDELRAALAVIPADNRDRWYRVGMALYRDLGDIEGFTVWDAWSRSSSKYDRGDAERVWASFRVDPPANRPSAKTIYHLAFAADRLWQLRFDQCHPDRRAARAVRAFLAAQSRQERGQ